MIYKIKKFLRHVLRRILFKDDCVICSSILKMEENALCVKCLDNLKSISSLKKYKNVYYIWMLDENFLKVLKASKNRKTFVEDLREIIVQKISFIIQQEKVSCLVYKDSEFFISLFNKKALENFSSYINEIKGKKLILKESLNKRIEDENIYFSLFITTHLIKNVN